MAGRDADVPVGCRIRDSRRRGYGARKVWKAARRGGHDVGRDQVARLMRAAGIDAVSVSVKWADAATRSVAPGGQRRGEAFQGGLLPQSYALARLGYTDDQIATITERKPA